MSYEFVKLSEVEVVETSTTANLLIEEDGEIKRLPASNFNTTPNVQADWNETDDTSPAYIANKPESLGGGGVETIVFATSSGMPYIAEEPYDDISFAQLAEAWKRGANLVYKNNEGEHKVLFVQFVQDSGVELNEISDFYYANSDGITNGRS